MKLVWTMYSYVIMTVVVVAVIVIVVVLAVVTAVVVQYRACEQNETDMV